VLLNQKKFDTQKGDFFMSQKIKKKFIEDVIFTDISAEIDSDVAVEQAAREAAVSAEASARAAADTTLQGNIDIEEAARIAEDELMLKLDGSRSMEADLSMSVSSSIVQPEIQSIDGNNITFRFDNWDANLLPEEQLTRQYHEDAGCDAYDWTVVVEGVSYSGNDIFNDSLTVINDPSVDGFAEIEGYFGFYNEIAGFQPTVETVFSIESTNASSVSYKITGLGDGVDAGDAVNKGQLDGAVQGVQDQLDALDANYATDAEVSAAVLVEKERAEAAEGVLQSNIDALQADVDQNEADGDADRALIRSEFAAADSTLQDNIDAEEARALAAEGVLQGNIDAEETRALAAEGTLQDNIDAEETRALAAEGTLQDNIDAEETRALAAEGTLQDNIDAEETARAAADTTLQSNIDTEKARIDAILDASTADADSFKEIVDLINSVDTENDSAFAAYVLSNDAALDQEVSDRQALEGEFDQYVIDNDAALAQEVSDRQVGDTLLQSSIDDEVEARTAAVAALQADVDQNEADGDADRALIRSEFAAADSTLQDNIDAEASARSSADSTLQGNIDAEETARIAADDALRGVLGGSESYTTIKALTDAVEALEGSSTGSISDLEDALAQEVSDRAAADTTLQSNIDTEKARIDAILDASEADKDSFAEIVTLINSVDTENDNAFAAYVLSNDAALAQEVSDRAAADSTLQDNIDAEASARSSADSTLQGNIDAEETARIAADDALDGRATTLEGEMDSAEGRLDALEAVAWQNEKFVLDATDIANEYVTLSSAPISGSMVAFVGRLAMHEGAAEDYQVSGSQVTFLNDLVGPGNQRLQVGDVIYVKYQA
jgi:hypothetical protein